MKRLCSALSAAALLLLPDLAYADAIGGEVHRQPLNIQAIVMFILFVGATLYITYWASKRTRSRQDYYTAGGRITGLQNGTAIAGDFMSAASFLGISALVYTSGYDGLIYSIGFLIGWPIILFLIAERLRNLGRYTFADVASYRLQQKPIRTLSACGSLVVVALYLIAQMVGAGKLIQLLFGLNYHVAVIPGRHPDGAVRAVRRHAGHHTGANYQGGAAAGRRQLYGADGDEIGQLRLQYPVRRSGEGASERHRHHEPRRLGLRSDFRAVARHGADVRHRRFAAHPDALLYRE